jgi:hypothetical protein
LIADMSVAPEIARLAEALTLVPARSPAQASGRETPRATATPPTLGSLAGQLRTIAAAPERWWRLVRFDPDRTLTIGVGEDPSFLAWLVVLPPGAAGRQCDCDVATLIAGDATEGADQAAGGAVLRHGSVRVHGQRHWLRGRGAGYSISLHARAHQPGREMAMVSGRRINPRVIQLAD